MVDTVAIVDLGRPVEADTDRHPAFEHEVAEMSVEQEEIGLRADREPNAGARERLADNTTEHSVQFDAAQKRLAAMEHDRRVRLLVVLQMLAHAARCLSGNRFRHEMRLLAPSRVHRVVDVAVGAIQVASAGHLPQISVKRHHRRSIHREILLGVPEAYVFLSQSRRDAPLCLSSDWIEVLRQHY
jgi:hypothetical protein